MTATHILKFVIRKNTHILSSYREREKVQLNFNVERIPTQMKGNLTRQTSCNLGVKYVVWHSKNIFYANIIPLIPSL